MLPNGAIPLPLSTIRRWWPPYNAGQIERLLRERRLRLANKLNDQLNLALQTITLDEVRTQVTQLAVPLCGRQEHFQRCANSASTRDRPPHPPPDYIVSIFPSLNRGLGSGGVSGWTNAFILDVFTSDTETRDIGVNLLITDLCNKQDARWTDAVSSLAPFAPGPYPQAGR